MTDTMTDTKRIVTLLMYFLLDDSENSNSKFWSAHDMLRLTLEALGQEDVYIDIMCEIFTRLRLVDDARRYVKSHDILRFNTTFYFSWSDKFFSEKYSSKEHKRLHYVIMTYSDGRQNKLRDKFIEIVNSVVL